MESMKTAVFGIYSTRSEVETATNLLFRSGFPLPDISILLPESRAAQNFGIEKTTKGPEGATAGAGSGAVLGRTLGLLAGIGALAIPGVGPLIAAGPIMSALAGMRVGGAAGGVTGALIGMGIPEYEAKRYEGRVAQGGILLSVQCDTSEEIERAREIMDRSGAEYISTTGNASRSSQSTDSRFRRAASAGNS